MGGAFKVIIIGSGLSGSLLANGLIRNNVDVTIYERLPKDAKREGYQIRLGAHSMIGFRACLDNDHIKEIIWKFGRADGARAGAPVFYDKRFQVLLNAARFPTYNKSAPINRVILRDILAKPVDTAGCLVSGKQFERYSILNPGTDSERVRAHFTDGTSDECDLLIGADGSHSMVNQQLGLNNISQINSHFCLISKCELPTERYQSLSEPLKKYPVLTYANNSSLFYCAYLPDKDGDDSRQHEIRAIDDKLSSCMFALTVPAHNCPPNLSELPCKEQWDFIETWIRSWASEYHEMLELLRDSPLYVYKARASKRPAKNWRKEARKKGGIELGHPRVWLLGDAMHAMLPARGMGGNTAMRDTATMLPLVRELATYSDQHKILPTSVINEKLTQYEQEMIPRAFSWVEKSGGTTLVPLDSERWTTRFLFFAAAQALNIAYIWKRFKALFITEMIVNDEFDLSL